MKRFFIIAMLILVLPIIALAGEKEELLLSKALLQERIGRLQAEFALSQQELREVEKKLAIADAKEKESKEQKKEAK
jgi:hypothetical protein